MLNLNIVFVLFAGVIFARFVALTPMLLFRSTGILILYTMSFFVTFLNSLAKNVLYFPILSHWSTLCTCGSLNISYPTVLGWLSTVLTTLFKNRARKGHQSVPFTSVISLFHQCVHHATADGYLGPPPLP